MIDGERLKELREAHKLTAQKLGDTVGVSKQQIVRYEKGQSDVSSNTLIRLAQHFAVSTDYLLGLTNKNRLSPEQATRKIEEVIAKAMQQVEQIKASIL